MRINEKHYPVLKYLNWHKPLWQHPYAQKHRDIEIFRLDKSEENNEEINKIALEIVTPVYKFWPEISTAFCKQIDVVSEPFFMAAMANRDKIFTPETVAELLPEGTQLSGTLIWKRVVFNYYYDGNITKHPDGITVIVHYENRVIYCCRKGKEWMSVANCMVEGIAPLNIFYQIAPLIILCFKKYADIEIVEAEKNKKVRTPDGNKLLVETDLKINYVDCSWFRTIVRNEGFLVSGHFRLQPCKKNGEWTRKLIYIEPFQKHGYTRRAKIEIQKEKEEKQ